MIWNPGDRVRLIQARWDDFPGTDLFYGVVVRVEVWPYQTQSGSSFAFRYVVRWENRGTWLETTYWGDDLEAWTGLEVMLDLI